MAACDKSLSGAGKGPPDTAGLCREHLKGSARTQTSPESPSARDRLQRSDKPVCLRRDYPRYSGLMYRPEIKNSPLETAGYSFVLNRKQSYSACNQTESGVLERETENGRQPRAASRLFYSEFIIEPGSYRSPLSRIPGFRQECPVFLRRSSY